MFGKKFKVWAEYKGFVDPKTEIDKKTLEFTNESPNKNPEYSHEGDSGFDLRAWIREDEEDAKFDKKTEEVSVTLKPLERRMVHTGLYFKLPEYTEMHIRSRSGCSINEGLVVINQPATIDEGYRGEVCVLVINLSDKKLTIKSGDRIAQGVLCPVYNSKLVDLVATDAIENDTERGSEGYGSTGKY